MLNRLLEIFKISTIGCLCAMSLTACNMFQSDLDWTEDIILNDGRIIRLTRHQEFSGPHSLEHTPSASAYWIEFDHPDTGEKIRWANEMDLAAVALFIKDGDFWLLTMPKYASSWNKYGRPLPPYFIFKYKDAWSGVPLHETPLKKIKVNLTVDPGMGLAKIKESNGHLTSDQTFETRFKRCTSCVIDLEGVELQKFNSERITERDYLVKPQGKRND